MAILHNQGFYNAWVDTVVTGTTANAVPDANTTYIQTSDNLHYTTAGGAFVSPFMAAAYENVTIDMRAMVIDTVANYPYPTIVFQVDLSISRTETIGPITNTRGFAVLHPDRHTRNQDNAVLSIDDRKNHISAMFPSITISGGRVLSHGDQLTAYGTDALYLRDMYSTESPSGVPKSGMAILNVVS